jgi:hypothetical protein
LGTDGIIKPTFLVTRGPASLSLQPHPLQFNRLTTTYTPSST